IQFDFIVFTDKEGDYDKEIESLGGKIIPILANNNFSRMWKLKRFLQTHSEYEIVHNHMLLNMMFSLRAAKMAKVKMRIAHSHNTSQAKTGLIGKFYESLAKKQIKKLATHKIACGIEAAHYLFPKEKDVDILPNAVEVEKLSELRKTTPKS